MSSGLATAKLWAELLQHQAARGSQDPSLEWSGQELCALADYLKDQAWISVISKYNKHSR